MVNFVCVYYVGIVSDFVCICAMSHRCGRDLGHLDFLCICVFFVFLYSVSVNLFTCVFVRWVNVVAVTSGTSHLVSLSELPERQFGQNSSRILFPYCSVLILDALCLFFCVFVRWVNVVAIPFSFLIPCVYVGATVGKACRCVSAFLQNLLSTLSVSVERYRWFNLLIKIRSSKDEW